VVGPDKGLYYEEAEDWVRRCKVAGGGWRMPRGDELLSLYAKGLGKFNMDLVFKTTDIYVWEAKRSIGSSNWCFDFSRGDEGETSFARASARVFGVRSPLRK
jgi:hypothetical protein